MMPNVIFRSVEVESCAKLLETEQDEVVPGATSLDDVELITVLAVECVNTEEGVLDEVDVPVITEVVVVKSGGKLVERKLDKWGIKRV
jgi:hypothetical protein